MIVVINSGDKMEKGVSSDVLRYFRLMGDTKVQAIDDFISTCSGREYFSARTIDDISSINTGDIGNDCMEILRLYSGFNFWNINNVLRGRWNYAENGNISRKAEFESLARDLVSIIDNNQHSIGDVMAYRGVSLDYFRDYGVESLNDLESLKGQFLLDRGVVSTSLVQDKSFFKRENELGLNYNVKIAYMVPREFGDGVYLGGYDTSYYREECEYLINSSNIAKVLDVSVSTDDTAVVRALLIPKRVYDDYYVHGGSSVK